MSGLDLCLLLKGLNNGGGFPFFLNNGVETGDTKRIFAIFYSTIFESMGNSGFIVAADTVKLCSISLSLEIFTRIS
jgi:hypothetical protein